jgi:cytochrome c oxidase subunit 2
VTSVLANVLDPQGPSAAEIDDLWWLMLVLGAAVFVLVAVLLVAGLRRNRDEDDEPSEQSRSWLVGGGVALPFIGVVVVLVATLAVMQDSPEEISDTAVTVRVTGHQWWWEFEYPDDGVVTATELHIPAGEPVRLEIGSADVIHSFWVPDLAGKRDAMPDHATHLTIEADRPGRYDGRCAEFCGLQHAAMDLVVVAHSPSDYAAWIESQSDEAEEPAVAEAARGLDLFTGAGGCVECHTIRGTEADGDVGPDLTHLMSRNRIAGGRVELTPENLLRWVHDPDQLKNGVEMPPTDLPDDDIAAIVAYLEGLE